jgi:hypothetical protein
VDVKVQPNLGGMDLDRWQQEVVDEFQPRTRPAFRQRFPLDDDDDGEPIAVPTRAKVLENKRLAEANGAEGREVVLDVTCAGGHWRFVIRLYRRDPGTVYIVRAYTQTRRFRQVENELRQALDTFRILPGR